jgi:RecG-like helicase
MGSLLKQLKFRIPETLPSYLISGHNLMSLHDAIHKIHSPLPMPK